MQLRRRFATASLRSRVLVVTGAVLTLLSILALVAYVVLLDRVLVVGARTLAVDQAHDIATAIQKSGVTSTSLKSDLEVPTQGSVLQVVDASGAVVGYSEGPLTAPPISTLHPAPGALVTDQIIGVPGQSHAPFVLAAQGLSGPGQLDGGVLYVAVPLQMETGLIKGATSGLAMLAIVSIVGLLWLIGRVLTSALGQVEAIRSTVAGIESGGNNERVPVPPGGDEITRLATTMNAMLDRVDRADAAQRAFVSNASHELRSPLSTIRAISETSGDAITPANLAVIHHEALRMQRLVDDLLTLAKADDNGLKLRRDDIDLDDVADQEVRRVRATTSLQVTSDYAPLRVQGDLGRLEQAVRNLVDNAARHATSSIRVTWHATPPGTGAPTGMAVLDVDNDGEPVPPDQREAVFGRFVRLQDARDRDSGGSGLGLAIVRAICEAHGGAASAGVAPDGWCRFEIRLPLPAHEQGDHDTADPEPMGVPGADGAGTVSEPPTTGSSTGSTTGSTTGSASARR